MATLLDASDRARRDAALENSSTLKALSVLEALVRAGRAVTLTDLMQATGLPKPSLHRTLSLFEDGGYVQREPGGRGYAVGPRLASLGLAILTHDTVATLRRAILRQLVADVGETCNLAMMRRGEIVYLDRVEADWPLRLHLPEGSTVPAHCSASGKLLLAFLPAAEREALAASMPMTRHTEHTITDRALMARELDRIVAAGYALDNEEYVAGVACVAVPVRVAGSAVAAVAVHAATARLPLQRAIEFVPRLGEAARAVAATFE
ncbi:MAG TPA: IclR family transcriptional regulator [Usitatibacter sp.]|nr:IclR family transcriptional regulator [Usitatibacter sp.]